ncbi:MAG: hypothetical protein QN229_02545 [Desulfurococcaceae archaeon TW002]
MLTIRNLGVLVFIIFLLAGFVLVIYYAAINTGNVGPGILITLSLYDVDVDKGGLVDVTSKILNDPDVFMYLKINANILNKLTNHNPTKHKTLNISSSTIKRKTVHS